MDAVVRVERVGVAPVEKALARVGARHVQLGGDGAHEPGVAFLRAVDAPHVAQPLHHARGARAVVVDAGEVLHLVDGRQGREDRADAGLAQHLHDGGHVRAKFVRQHHGVVVLLRVRGHVGPVIVAVVAAVFHERPVIAVAAGEVALYERDALARGRAEDGLVRHLGVQTGEWCLEQVGVKMIPQLLVRQRALHQRVAEYGDAQHLVHRGCLLKLWLLYHTGRHLKNH